MSIFRYPGGKSRLIDQIFPLLDPYPHDEYHDVFTGGGSTLIAAAERWPAARLYANDKDPNIASFWRLVADGTRKQIEWFFNLLRIKPTVERFQAMRAAPPEDDVSRAYYAVFFNRTAFSGIYTSQPIGGMEQKSKWTVDCRYNAPRLIKEFTELAALFHGRLSVSSLDVLDCLDKIPKDKTCYLDPPYFKQGSALYPVYMTPDEHVTLAVALKQRTNWVLSYDDCKEIRDCYSWAKIDQLSARYSVNGEKKEWAKKQELLIHV